MLFETSKTIHFRANSFYRANGPAAPYLHSLISFLKKTNLPAAAPQSSVSPVSVAPLEDVLQIGSSGGRSVSSDFDVPNLSSSVVTPEPTALGLLVLGLGGVLVLRRRRHRSA